MVSATMITSLVRQNAALCGNGQNLPTAVFKFAPGSHSHLEPFNKKRNDMMAFAKLYVHVVFYLQGTVKPRWFLAQNGSDFLR